MSDLDELFNNTKKDPESAKTEPKSNKTVQSTDPHDTFESSVEHVNKLRKGRLESEIPLTDPYWVEQEKHRQKHNK